MILSLTYIAIVLNDPIGLNVKLAEFCYLFNELTEVSVKASIDTFKFWVFVVFLSHFNSPERGRLINESLPGF